MSERGALDRVEAWFAARGIEPFPYQREAWRRSLAGESGLIHAPTGCGKTHAAWFGPLLAGWADERARRKPRRRADAPPLTVLWITPMRALAQDLGAGLADVAAELAPGWIVEVRTGDASSALRARQSRRLPTVLVTTPESACLLLAHETAPERFGALHTVVVDEWHELLGTKRGTQTELLLARLRALAPGLRTWGLSATLGDPRLALEALVGVGAPGVVVAGPKAREIDCRTILPDDAGRFPWAGHLGLHLAEQVAAELDAVPSAIVFVNTRSQAERWFQAFRYLRYERQAEIGLHHGSIERDERLRIERGMADGSLWITVATSSLDLGVDFAPVELVVQVGSPKGIARLAQRAGRSGHGPGRVSRVLGVPTHALELVEFAAARRALARSSFEGREPLLRPFDVLAQHVVTVALGGGFVAAELLAEVRGTVAYRELTDDEWQRILAFCCFGGPALSAYERFARIREEKGRYVGGSRLAARDHRMAIGTIASFGSLRVVLRNGRELGSVEELFLGRLAPGEAFTFAGRTVELVRVEADKAVVRPARSKAGKVARWMGGRMPLSNRLAHEIREVLGSVGGRNPELVKLRPLLARQREASRLPAADELLIERIRLPDGDHAFLFPIAGRLVHEGLATLLSYRLTRRAAVTVVSTCSDWGLSLGARRGLGVADDEWTELLSGENLLEDILASLDAAGLARRHFREVARVAGLVHEGHPRRRKTTRQLQASAGLVYDVLVKHEPDSLLLEQARREALERSLEFTRLRATLAELAERRVVVTRPARLTPFAFPLWADKVREHVSSESWEERVRAMVETLEAGDGVLGGAR